jgi:hypothetical protein
VFVLAEAGHRLSTVRAAAVLRQDDPDRRHGLDASPGMGSGVGGYDGGMGSAESG